LFRGFWWCLFLLSLLFCFWEEPPAQGTLWRKQLHRGLSTDQPVLPRRLVRSQPASVLCPTLWHKLDSHGRQPVSVLGNQTGQPKAWAQIHLSPEKTFS
jgi:hypothetical protein